MGRKRQPPIKVYFVIGEESGDALGSELMAGLEEIGVDAEFFGLAGRKMQARGLSSLFDIADISVMGATAVVARLPTLLKRIRQTADDIIATQPDILVLIDSPDFNQRVGRKVREKCPETKIIKYVCPSVWAWRPGRAPKMRDYLDHVLCVLPFEPEFLKQLGGPEASYVGHPLSSKLSAHTRSKRKRTKNKKPVLLALPGSRRSEVKQLLPDIAKTLEILDERGKHFEVLMPVVPHLAEEIASTISGWKIQPEIIVGDKDKLAAFGKADVAIAASGTVLLELALHRIPMISIYRLDWLMHLFRSLIYGWSAALPNLILDEPLIPERVGDMIRPGWLARAVEHLARDGSERQIQLDGFERMSSIMIRDQSPGIEAAKKIRELLAASK